MHLDGELIAAFFTQCTNDKNYLNYILNTYPAKVKAVGVRLLEHDKHWHYATINGQVDEFLDFIDGNGFEISKNKDGRTYYITPILPPVMEEMLPF